MDHCRLSLHREGILSIWQQAARGGCASQHYLMHLHISFERKTFSNARLEVMKLFILKMSYCCQSCLLRQGISIHFRLSWHINVFMFFGIFPKGFSEPLKYWKGVRIYKLTIRPISNVTLGNKEENILHYPKLFLFYSFSPRIFIIPSLQETIKIANLFPCLKFFFFCDQPQSFAVLSYLISNSNSYSALVLWNYWNDIFS